MVSVCVCGLWCGAHVYLNLMVIVVLGIFPFYCRERNERNVSAIDSKQATRIAKIFGAHRARVACSRNDDKRKKNEDESWKNFDHIVYRKKKMARFWMHWQQAKRFKANELIIVGRTRLLSPDITKQN